LGYGKKNPVAGEEVDPESSRLYQAQIKDLLANPRGGQFLPEKDSPWVWNGPTTGMFMTLR
jgi:hypothetical protein